ncbi:MAG: hypothetical protein AAGC81_20235 [Pseudomonadota bacterium]
MEELLDRFENTLTYDVELKKPIEGLPEAVVEAVQTRGLASRTFLCSITDDAGLKRANSASSPLLPIVGLIEWQVLCGKPILARPQEREARERQPSAV